MVVGHVGLARAREISARAVRPRVALIVGNGLSISYCDAAGAPLDGWHPSSPLRWDVPNPSNLDAPALSELPHLDAAIREARESSSSQSDFAIFERLLRLESRGEELLVEARHYICLAYARFQAAADSSRPAGWLWQNWLNNHRAVLTCVVSLNYDLILERSLARANISIRGFGITHERHGLSLLKPHGSIDFDAREGLFAIRGVASPPRYLISQNDTPLRRVSAEELFAWRTDLNVVLPGELSFARDFQWAKSGYEYFNGLASTWSDCVIVGVSYAVCDQPEIDSLLDGFSPGTRVHIVDPKPPSGLCEAVLVRGLRLHCGDSPPAI